MPKLTSAFNLPFNESIKAAERRGVVLPDVYYNELQGIAKQHAFSIAGLTSLNQLEQVRDSLSSVLKNGGSFQSWKRDILKNIPDLRLSKAMLETIYRTNIQQNYNRGRWEKFTRNSKIRPYLMYDAINDSRVRPEHLKLDGTIRRFDDAFWNTHAPSLGYNCRCRLISLSEKQAMARSRGENGLNKQIKEGYVKIDKGFDYNPGEGLDVAINQLLNKATDSIIKTAVVERVTLSKIQALAALAATILTDTSKQKMVDWLNELRAMEQTEQVKGEIKKVEELIKRHDSNNQ